MICPICLQVLRVMQALGLQPGGIDNAGLRGWTDHGNGGVVSSGVKRSLY